MNDALGSRALGESALGEGRRVVVSGGGTTYNESLTFASSVELSNVRSLITENTLSTAIQLSTTFNRNLIAEVVAAFGLLGGMSKGPAFIAYNSVALGVTVGIGLTRFKEVFVNAVSYDGAFLYRSSAMTGQADVGTLTGSLWFKTTDTNGFMVDIRNFAEGHTRLYIRIGTNGVLEIQTEDTSSVTTCLMNSTTGWADGEWHHLHFSYDETSNTKELWIDGADELASANFNGSVYFSTVDRFDVASIAGTASYAGCLAEVWIGPGLLYPPSTNNSSFLQPGGYPEDLGADGSNPGAQPLIYLKGDATTITTNSGSGEDFTKSGSIVDCDSIPGGYIEASLSQALELGVSFIGGLNLDSSLALSANVGYSVARVLILDVAFSGDVLVDSQHLANTVLEATVALATQNSLTASTLGSLLSAAFNLDVEATVRPTTGTTTGEYTCSVTLGVGFNAELLWAFAEVASNTWVKETGTAEDWALTDPVTATWVKEN